MKCVGDFKKNKIENESNFWGDGIKRYCVD